MNFIASDHLIYCLLISQLIHYSLVKKNRWLHYTLQITTCNVSCALLIAHLYILAKCAMCNMQYNKQSNKKLGYNYEIYLKNIMENYFIKLWSKIHLLLRLNW